jgi:hypothetical protein
MIQAGTPFKLEVLTEIGLVSRLHEHANARNLHSLDFHDDVVSAIRKIEKPVAAVVSNRLTTEQSASLGVQHYLKAKRQDVFDIFVINLEISKQGVATSLTQGWECVNEEEKNKHR